MSKPKPMTYFYYKTKSWAPAQDKINQDQVDLWKVLSEKKNWRIVQLPNGYFQTEYQDGESWVDVTRRETVEAAEVAIDKSIEHYSKKLELLNGPKVVKTFE